MSPSTGTVFRALFGLPLLGLVAYSERRRFGALPGATIRLAAVAGVFFAGVAPEAVVDARRMAATAIATATAPECTRSVG